MHRLTVPVPTANRTINKRVAMTIVRIILSGALLWLGAISLIDTSIAEVDFSTQISTNEEVNTWETVRIEQFEMEDQIIMTHAELAKTSKEIIAFQQFKSEIAMATEDLDSSEPITHRIVEQLTSLKACLSLTYLMTRDFFTRGHEVDKIFIAEATALDRMTSDSISNAKQAIDRLHTSLQIIEGSFTETYLAGPVSIKVDEKLPEKAIDTGSQARDMNNLHREFSTVAKQNSRQIREWAMGVGNELMETAALSTPTEKIRIAARNHHQK
ncbi:MAG: hypothetical protein Q8J76_15090 [Desulfobulbaceae bacterium]|nr:hypothetical protein [Desulfobulbaceae bacterium]